VLVDLPACVVPVSAKISVYQKTDEKCERSLPDVLDVSEAVVSGSLMRFAEPLPGPLPFPPLATGLRPGVIGGLKSQRGIEVCCYAGILMLPCQRSKSHQTTQLESKDTHVSCGTKLPSYANTKELLLQLDIV
jgi:hypothetical protein